MKAKILLVDDDPFTRRFIEGLLSTQPVDLQVATNAAEARRAFRQTDFNLILLDQRLPDGNGLGIFAEIRRERPNQLAILITGHAEVREAVRAVRDGLFDYLTKPFENIEELEAAILRALEMDRAYREIGELRESLNKKGALSAIIGRSAAIERLLEQVSQVAPLDTTVLIEGESGTGKELIAQLIHRSSGRSGKPLLEVNCGALSEQLLESTLFGYEKGAFTGAAKSTGGYFEKSDGGTLFLDEIVDMSAKLQSSLLRVLQDGKFSRLGSTSQLRSDFRLICATNKSLEDEVAAGRFRGDLYYRLKVVALRIPPLRERRGDVTLLAEYFLGHFNQKFARKVGPFMPGATALLEAAAWPGNVRELQHFIERIVATKPSGAISANELEMFVNPAAAATGSARPLQTFRDAREEFVSEYFSRLLDISGGNVSEAARLSGMARQNLYPYLRRMKVVNNS